MPSKVDQAFIDNLQNFTDSLEGIVELMQSQADKGDAINKMMSAMDGTKMSDIAEDIKNLTVITERVDDRTKQILNEVKAARKQKETGMFEKIESGENKNKIVDAISVVTLIAGGVLAIGAAFKLIGHVDFVSVIALSIGILAISYAFKEIAQMKELTPKKVGLIGLSMITMASAITVSSLILKWMQPLDFNTGLSLIMISGALGVATFLIMKALGSIKMDAKDIPKLLYLPIMLPAIAAGITLSSFILQYIEPISLDQALSVAMIGLAMVGAAIAFNFISKAIDKMSIKDLLLASAAIPLIAGGIVAASWIFKLIAPFDLASSLELVVSSLAMGLAMLTFVPTMYILGKMKTEDLVSGALGVVLTASAIVAVSHILQLGDYGGKKPSIEWSLVTGISLLSFVPAIYFLGEMKTKDLISGALGVVLTASAIVAVSHILQLGDYGGNRPNNEWSLNVGLSLITFIPAMYILGKMKTKDLISGTIGVILTAGAIVAVSYILHIGKYDGNRPTVEWSLNVGLSLITFIPAMYLLGKMSPKDLISGTIGVILTASAIVAVSYILNLGNFDGNRPNVEWTLNVGLSLITFIPAMYLLGKMNPKDLIMGGLGVIIVSVAIMASSWILSVGNYNNNYPNKDWAMGTGLAMILFTPAIVILGSLAMTGIGALAIVAGAGMTLIVAATIAESSHVLNEGDYSGAPPLEWAKSMALLLPVYGISMVGLGLMPKKLLERGSEAILTIATAIKESSFELQGGNYTGGPTKEWAEGIGLALGAFASALNVAMSAGKGLFSKSEMKPEDFVSFIKTVSMGMVGAAEVLKGGDWTGNVPPKSWGEGVGAALLPFIDAFGLIVSSDQSKRLMKDLQKSKSSGDESDFVYFMKEVARTMIAVDDILKDKSWSGLNGLSKINMDAFSKFIDSISLENKKIKALENFADALKDVSKSFNKLKGSGIDKFNNLTASVTIMSAVDTKRLGDVIGVLHTNKDKLNDVTKAQKSSGRNRVKQSMTKVEKAVSNKVSNNMTYGESIMAEKYDGMLERMDMLLELMTQEKSGENVNSKDSVK